MVVSPVMKARRVDKDDNDAGNSMKADSWLLTPSIISVVALALAYPLSTLADNAPHVHGQAHITLVASDNELQLELEAPAASLVGFEHRPQNPEQRQALDTATRDLNQADGFLHIEGADCQSQSVWVEAPFSAGGQTEHDDHDDHHEHGGHEAHASFRAGYTYQCDNLAELSGLTVGLFDRYPVHEIKVQWIAGGQQGAQTLTARANKIDLK